MTPLGSICRGTDGRKTGAPPPSISVDHFLDGRCDRDRATGRHPPSHRPTGMRRTSFHHSSFRRKFAPSANSGRRERSARVDTTTRLLAAGRRAARDYHQGAHAGARSRGLVTAGSSEICCSSRAAIRRRFGRT